MSGKEAVKLAYIEFQKDFEDGEETNQWEANVIEGLKKAEKDLEMIDLLKKYKKYVLPNYELLQFNKINEVAELYKLDRWLENE